MWYTIYGFGYLLLSSLTNKKCSTWLKDVYKVLGDGTLKSTKTIHDYWYRRVSGTTPGVELTDHGVHRSFSGLGLRRRAVWPSGCPQPRLGEKRFPWKREDWTDNRNFPFTMTVTQSFPTTSLSSATDSRRPKSVLISLGQGMCPQR